MKLSWPSLLLAASLAFPALAQTPQVSPADLQQPLPKPYSATANAEADVTAALARAKLSHKRLLIDLGANWCPDCRVLAGVIAIPKINSFIHDNFEVVSVDVDRFNKNLDVPTRFGAPKPEGIPTILVISPDGKLLNTNNREDLSNDRSMTPQAIVDWLAQWTPATSHG